MTFYSKRFTGIFLWMTLASLLLLGASAIFAPAAQVEEVIFASQSLRMDKKLTIVLPGSYPNSPEKYYPTVYLLGGHGGDHRQWHELTNLARLVDEYDIIAVCPDGSPDSWYFDSPIVPNNRYESFIAKDLIDYVDSRYRTIAKPEARGITGLSMGGHGAMFVGLRHPELFGAVAAMSGGLDLRPFPDEWGIKKWLGEQKEHSENWESHSVINVIDHIKPGQQILFDCGKKDFFIEVNRATHEKMKTLEIPHIYEEYPGGHDWDYWETAVARHMAFFADAFNGRTYTPAREVD
jgi:S-formylglutathione hydrolase FrmB